MSDRRYTEDHEWIAAADGVGTVGISDYAQEQLGDVVFVELPAVGQTLAKGAEACVIESVKAASEVYAPISGEVAEVNEALVDNPGLVNESPFGDGWFIRIKLADPAELDGLMDEAAYKSFVEGLA